MTQGILETVITSSWTEEGTEWLLSQGFCVLSSGILLQSLILRPVCGYEV